MSFAIKPKFVVNPLILLQNIFKKLQIKHIKAVLSNSIFLSSKKTILYVLYIMSKSIGPKNLLSWLNNFFRRTNNIFNPPGFIFLSAQLILPP